MRFAHVQQDRRIRAGAPLRQFLDLDRDRLGGHAALLSHPAPGQNVKLGGIRNSGTAGAAASNGVTMPNA
jgi:hypothetical protein